MSLTLRTYQQEFSDKLWLEFFDHNDALGVAPCGAGKTEIMFDLISRGLAAKPGFRVMIVLNKVSLVSQTARRAGKVFNASLIGEACGSRGSWDFSKQITIGTVQTLSRLDPTAVNLLILDEVHRSTPGEESSYSKLIEKLKAANPRLKICGMTATPFRSTGYIYPSALFRKVTVQIELKEMIDQGYLVHPKLKHTREAFDTKGLRTIAGDWDMKQLEERALNADKVAAQLKDAMPQLEGRKKVAWACVSIAHAEMLRERIPEPAAIVHSKLTQEQQVEELASFENGSVRHMVFVSMLGEGYDFPPIDTIVLMRPTKSPVLYVQTVGRALRPSPGKEFALILDYGNVVMNCGPLDKPIVRGPGRAGQKPIEIPMRFCEGCYSYIPSNVRVCPDCGYEKPAEPTKNLTKKAANGTLLSERAKPEWFEFRMIQIASHNAGSGRPCITITYIPEWHFLPVREYATFDEAQAWLGRRATEKLARVGLRIRTVSEAKEWIAKNPKPLTIVRKGRALLRRERFPEILEVVYDKESDDKNGRETNRKSG